MNIAGEQNNESILEKNSNTVFFSIVIPTFNSANLLLRCLVALEKQTVSKSEFEVVVADDGSNDETIQILSQFKEKNDLDLKWISILNSGPGNARNAGVKVASGKWLGFLDADVIPKPNWVEISLTLIIKKPFAGAFEGRTEVTKNKNATPFTHQTENIDGGRYPTCNLIVRRSLAKFYPAYKIPFREDTDLAFSILDSGYKIIFSPELIVEHPPLKPSYSRPFSLARRYYYDGLLARRFPLRYKYELDAHRIIGIKVPHLKKKLFSFFAVSQIILIFITITEFNYNSIFPYLFLYLAGLSSSSISSLRYANLKILSLKDWVVFLSQLNILPWIMFFFLIKGRFDFRNESKFSKE